MKKVLFAVALVMGLGSSVAFANNMASDVESTIKEAAVEVAEDGVKTYKVTLVDAVGTESVVFFNEKGEMLK